jgi:hypothetical protein
MVHSAFVAQTIAMLEGRFADAIERTRQAELVLRERAPGITFEADTVRINALIIHWFRGAIKVMCARVLEHRRSAQERGAVLMWATVSSGSGVLCTMLRDDDADAARRLAQRSADVRSPDWPNARTYNDLVAQANIDLYASPHGPEAWQRAQREWPALRRSLFLRMQTVRIEATELRARAALAAAAGKSGREQAKLLHAVESGAQKLEREHSAWAAPLAQLLRAGVAHLRGDAGATLALLDRAIAGCAAADLDLYLAVARRRRGELSGGSEGRALIAQADEWMSAQTIKVPARAAAMLAPAFSVGGPVATQAT